MRVVRCGGVRKHNRAFLRATLLRCPPPTKKIFFDRNKARRKDEAVVEQVTKDLGSLRQYLRSKMGTRWWEQYF